MRHRPPLTEEGRLLHQAADRRYYQKHKEKRIVYQKKYRPGYRRTPQRKAYMREYFKLNSDKRKEWQQKCYRKNFLEYMLSNAARHDKKMNRENNITLEDLIKLLEEKKWICAGTGIKMMNEVHDLRTISIDRVDSTKGHIRGNIQLVCKFYNQGKGNRPDTEAKAVIKEIEYNAQMELLKDLKARGLLKLDPTGKYHIEEPDGSSSFSRMGD